MEECPSCGKRYAKYPWKDEQGKIIWKNMFKMDAVSILFLIAIILMTYGYIKDTADCKEVIDSPCDFCAKSNCCNYIVNGNYIPDTSNCAGNLDVPDFDFVDLG